MSALKLITAPAEEPVNWAKAAAHLRIDNTEEIPLILALITTARQEAEKITRRALITQTWELVLDSFPACGVDIPLPTLQSVTSVKYTGSNGAEQTLSSAAYQVDSDSEPARIVPAYGYLWPVTLNQLNTVRIRYVCGYGLAAAVPAAIKQWMLVRIATLYENREGTVQGSIAETPFINGLLDEYRVLSF